MEEKLSKIRKTEENKKMKKDFVKKFFPNCINSPGGTERLVPARNTNSTTVEGVEKMEKMLSRDFLEHSAEI